MQGCWKRHRVHLHKTADAVCTPPGHRSAGEQLADVVQHQQEHGAESMLLLPVPAPQPPPQQQRQQQQQQHAEGAADAAGPSGVDAAQEAAPQPFWAAGVFGIGLGPGVPARRT